MAFRARKSRRVRRRRRASDGFPEGRLMAGTCDVVAKISGTRGCRDFGVVSMPSTRLLMK
jgi:hypothetical protein